MKIIEFDGDPMLQLEKFEELEQYTFYLNKEAMDEIKSYSSELRDNIPEFFNAINPSFVLLAEGGIDEEGNEFPDTYIGIRNISNEEYGYQIAGIYASDMEYSAPNDGEEIFLKKNSKKIKL
jgi:hypothetical protein